MEFFLFGVFQYPLKEILSQLLFLFISSHPGCEDAASCATLIVVKPLHFSSHAVFYCSKNEILIAWYLVIYNFRAGTGRVLEKKFGTGRVPGSRQGLLRSCVQTFASRGRSGSSPRARVGLLSPKRSASLKDE